MMVDMVVALNLVMFLSIFDIGALVAVTAALGTHDTPATCTLTSEASTSLRPYSVLEHC